MKLGFVIYTPPRSEGERSKSISLSTPLVCSSICLNHNKCKKKKRKEKKKDEQRIFLLNCNIWEILSPYSYVLELLMLAFTHQLLHLFTYSFM